MSQDSKDNKKKDAAAQIEPKQYWETKMSVRARPQYDPYEVAHKFLDEMEAGGRLHNRRKRDQDA